jgi:hypothetical protein
MTKTCSVLSYPVLLVLGTLVPGSCTNIFFRNLEDLTTEEYFWKDKLK